MDTIEVLFWLILSLLIVFFIALFIVRIKWMKKISKLKSIKKSFEEENESKVYERHNIEETVETNKLIKKNLDTEQTTNIQELGSFSIKIANKAVNFNERVLRLVNVEGTSWLRKAQLHFDDQKINLSCKDDSDSNIEIAKFKYEEIKEIKYKKSAITPFDHMKKPLMTGFFVGVCMFIVLLFKVNDTVGAFSPFVMFLPCIVSMSLLFLLININNITWKKMTKVSFYRENDKILEFAINDENIDLLLTITKSKNIADNPIE